MVDQDGVRTTGPGMAKRLHALVHAPRFEAAVVALVLVSAVLVGLETSSSIMERHGALIRAAELVVVALFALEALLKLGAEWPRPWRYFRSGWNCFDFTIVVLCLLPAAGPHAAIVRLARVLRAVRLVEAIPRLRLIVSALLHSIPAMSHVALLLGLQLYIYAVLGVFLFGGNDPGHFGSLGRSALTLFQVMTMEGWVDIMHTQAYGSAVFPPADVPATGAVSAPAPIAARVYFISFIVLGTMIVLNLFIGIIVNGMDEARAEEDRREESRRRARGEGISARDELEKIRRELLDLSRRLETLRLRDPVE